MLAPRRPPFDSWPVHHADPHYGYAWYCGGGLIVSHVTIAHATVDTVEAYHSFEDQVLHERGPELAKAGGLFVIHDWRAVTSYDGAARTRWQDRMRARVRGYLKGSIVCVDRANALLRMAVQAANLVASLTHGAKVELTTDIDDALARHVVKRPSVMPSLVR